MWDYIFYRIYTVLILVLKGTCSFLKEILSKYELETFILVSNLAEYIDVLFYLIWKIKNSKFEIWKINWKNLFLNRIF